MPISQWVREKLPGLRARGSPVAPIEFIQRAGELVFVPAQWAHAVLNLGDVVGVSTQLFLTPAQQLEQIREVASQLAELANKKGG